MKMGHQGIHQRIYLGISKVGEEVQSSQPLLMEYLHHQMSIMTKIFPMAFGAILPGSISPLSPSILATCISTLICMCMMVFYLLQRPKNNC